MSDAETLAVYNAKAGDYAELTVSDALDPTLARFIDALPEGGTILDLGCGPGLHAARMADAGFRVDAWDASEEMIKLARQHPQVAARQATFDDLAGAGPYDGIWANFSLLHADPDKLDGYLSNIAAAISPGGLFHIGMKTGTGMKRDPLGRRYTYVEQDDLRARFMALGLVPEYEDTGCDKGLDGVMADWVTILARKIA